jgi:leucyl-tRNA synthetase
VNGKLRDRVTTSATLTEAEARELVLAREKIKIHLDNKPVRRLIYVPGKLINIVV